MSEKAVSVWRYVKVPAKYILNLVNPFTHRGCAIRLTAASAPVDRLSIVGLHTWCQCMMGGKLHGVVTTLSQHGLICHRHVS